MRSRAIKVGHLGQDTRRRAREQRGQRRNWLRRWVRGGASELPVIAKERRGEAQQRLHGQEISLASAGYGPPAQQLPELLPRLADRQIHVTPEIGHIAREPR